MIDTPIAHHRAPDSRALSSMMFPLTARTSVHATSAPMAAVPVATADSATTTDTTAVVNPWLGGGTCGDEGTGSSSVVTSFGFAPKRIAPGRLEAMT